MTSAGNLNLTLVQYPDFGTPSGGTVALYYRLTSVNDGVSDEVRVERTYKSSNTTITLTRVPKGTFKLTVSNYTRGGGVQAIGNGYHLE